MMEKDNIYDLELHQSTEIISNIGGVKFVITRVPGGWIYEKHKANSGNVSVSVVFVPYDNEFQEK